MMEVQKLLEGRIVDERFPLVELLGGTAHSSVFRTECEAAPNRQAAIKLIPAPATTPEAQLTRWRLAARFSHPALLRIFDMGRCDFEGRPMLYVVTEVAEENLADILPVRCLSPGEVDAMLGPALEALNYLHAKGFVHGRLQPANILAIGDQVKLSSDSIARIGEAAGAHDARDQYRAPESNLSAASDVWSLGVTIVQCLTGRLPERGTGSRNSVTVPADVPAPFSDLARHCLNPLPQRRWTVAQIQSSLGRPSAVVASAAPAPPAEVAAASEVPNVSAPSPASAFSKPAAAGAARRRFHLKKQYRLPLAILAAAAAAFVLGIVISGTNSDSSVTASAPAAVLAKNSGPNAPMARSIPPPATKPHPASPEKLASNSRQPKPISASAQPKARENNPERQFADARPSSPALDVTSVAPAEPAQPSSPISGGVVPGSVTRRALPRVPKGASDTVWGTVRVSVVVDVDPRGHVVEAKLDSPGPSRYFAGLSMAAARDWKFAPPRVGGNIVPSEWVIDFGYSKTDTSAEASERHP